jgi:peptidoglycan/xylan/chitin deacetylase (PgdA/CDA1 family)
MKPSARDGTTPAPDAAGATVGRGQSACLSLEPLVSVAIAAKIVAMGVWAFTTHHGMAMALFFAPDPFVLYALFAPSSQGLCRVFTHFTSERRAIWLTIDDGPDEHDTPRILDLLDEHRARATFFVVGERGAKRPDLLREIVRRGHQLAHHTHTHPAGSFWCASPGRLAAELDQTLDVLREVGVRPEFFRAPVGIKHLFLARALALRQLKCVGWTIRSGDCHIDSPEQLVARITPRLRPGAIILLHEGPSVPRPVRVTGIALLLHAIAAQNLVCEIPEPCQLR